MRQREEKVTDGDEGWRHACVVLQSLNPAIPSIELGPDEDLDVISGFEGLAGRPTSLNAKLPATS